jgi:hypothetical protein
MFFFCERIYNVTLCHSVTHVMGVTLITNIIVIGHQICYRWPSSNRFK